MRRAIWIIGLAVALGLVGAACGSGPSEDVLAADRRAQVTTTTEAPPEGVVIVSIVDGAFRPSNVKIDVTATPIVEWRHQDSPDREYVIEARARGGEVPFLSETLRPGDTFQVDFSQLELDIYRYGATLGLTRVPGTIDTRPEQ
jgi:hypothetical protein